jgi:hypothetical protein
MAEMTEEPAAQHKWLQKLVGEWAYEVEAMMTPDGPPEKFTGTESVRSIGGLWTVGEGTGEMPDGTPATTIMTLGYDPKRERFVGTFIASMMTYLWVYEGRLDESGRKLALDTEGPDMAVEGKTAKYRETIEFISDDHRTFSSSVLGDDGEWRQVMKAHYRRKG